MTLGEWLGLWYTMYVAPSGHAPSTLAMYHRAIDSVPAYLANAELSCISSLDLLGWLQHVAGVGVGTLTSGERVEGAKPCPRAAQLDHVMLTQALRVAGRLGLCRADLMDAELVPYPVHHAAQAVIFTAEQLHAYLVAAAHTDCYPLSLLAACGLRRGEALGVRWTDIDLDSGVLSIQRQRMRMRHEYIPAPLKTVTSRRQIMLPPYVLDALRVWPRSVSGWVVDTTPEHWQRVHQRIIAACGLPSCTIHGLRHTFATLAAQDVPIKLVQQALGHSTYRLTADLYADHLLAPSEVPGRVFLDL